MTGSPRYGSPASFRQALTDKLRSLAETSRWALPQLQRQLAYDRFLERLYRVDGSWIVKGATALLARDIGVRATLKAESFGYEDLCLGRQREMLATHDVLFASVRPLVPVDEN